MNAEDHTLGEISNWLYKNEIPSLIGKTRWNQETISKLLRNEKYIGGRFNSEDICSKPIFGQAIRNNDKLEKPLIQGHHLAIMSRELFVAANQGDKADL